MKLLIAHDGSSQADAVLDDIPLAGLPTTGEAVVVTVGDAWATAASGTENAPLASTASLALVLEEIGARAQATAERVATRIAAALPGWSVVPRHAVGSPAWELIREVDERRPDLLLIGATGAGPIERFVFGTTVHQVLVHASCSVRVVRRRQRAAAGPPRLLVGIDGSDASLAAARAVAARTWPAGSSARVVAAASGWMLAALAPPGQGASSQKDAAAEAEAALSAAGLAASSVAREGDPKQVLLDEAASWDADAIVLGARGRHGLSRLLGSVALATASRAGCSVELVR